MHKKALNQLIENNNDKKSLQKVIDNIQELAYHKKFYRLPINVIGKIIKTISMGGFADQMDVLETIISVCCDTYRSNALLLLKYMKVEDTHELCFESILKVLSFFNVSQMCNNMFKYFEEGQEGVKLDYLENQKQLESKNQELIEQLSELKQSTKQLRKELKEKEKLIS